MTLPDLDAIDWSAHEHAYGKADDVPAMLRGMLDPERSDEAFADFWAAVNHQGWATPAAVPCMPWLVAALDEPGTPLVPLIHLLGELALGGSHQVWLGQRLAAEAPSALHEPVRAIHGRLVGYLDHDDEAVRAHAALALASFAAEPEAATARPALRAMVERERKADLKAAAILALGIVGDDTDPELIGRALAAKRVPAAVAVAARAARVWLAGSDATDEDLLGLLEAAAATKRARAKGLPWADGDLGELAEGVALWALRGPVPAPRVLTLLEQVAPAVREKVAEGFVDQVFPRVDRWPPDRWPPNAESLDESERIALRLVAESERLWRGYLGERLRDRGLSRTARGLRVFVGLEEGGALDQHVEVEGESMLLWRALRRAAPIHDDLSAADVAKALDASQVRAAVLEVLDDKHHYGDVVPRIAGPHSLHAEGPYVQGPHAQLATVLLALLRPHASTFIELARERLQAQLERLEKRSPNGPEVAIWLTVLQEDGPLDERWDPLLASRVLSPPAVRVPQLLAPLIRSLPIERRDAIVLQAPLWSWSGVTHREKGVVVFEWQALVASEGWWILGACETPAAAAALVDAIRQWSELPPLPKDPPRGVHVRPHHPFPVARFRALVDEWSHDFVRETLEPLQGDDSVDQELLRELLTMVD